jgi:hypothetical protein
MNGDKEREEDMEAKKAMVERFRVGFRYLQEATGIRSIDGVDGIIQKCIAQDDGLKALKAKRDAKAATLAELKQKRQELATMLGQLRSEGPEDADTAEGGGNRPAEDIERTKAASEARLEQFMDKYSQLSKVLVDVTAGVGHMTSNLKPISVYADV